jgi:hypothetical protein
MLATEPTEPGARKKSPEEIAELIAALQKQINELVDRQNERKKLETRVRGYTELNRITRYAVNLSQGNKPRDTISFLQRSDITPPRGSKRSSEMAELARDYHYDLQNEGCDIGGATREAAMQEAFEALPQPDPEIDMTLLDGKLSEEDVATALSEAAAGKAAGMNGIMSEFWQRLQTIHSANRNSGAGNGPAKRTCDIVKVLTWVYNDIEDFGVLEDTAFALGWMCPLFKKKDRSDIANYRPITVLNADYKIFTKALANKLAKVAPHIIHKDQAGFMKGRKITDAIYLAQEVVEYAEEDLQNGVIVALD